MIPACSDFYRRLCQALAEAKRSAGARTVQMMSSDESEQACELFDCHIALRLCVKRTLAAILLLLANISHAQDSQFLFDPNGNLLVQTAEVVAPPQIIGQPQNRIVAPDEAASLFVVALDTRALTYQWQFSGANITDATNDALLLQNVTTNNEGEYRVVLTNPSGSVTSAPALLMIDSDADGLPDSWERAFFTNLNQYATADFDGDGVSNLQEFLDGSNPTNNFSAFFRITLLKDGNVGNVIKTPDQPSYTNGQTVTLTAAPAEAFHLWTGDVLTRSNSITLVMTNNKTLFAHFGPVPFLWTNAVSSDWDAATNWTPNFVPGSNDSVIIRSSVTVTLNTAADLADLTLGDGSTPTLTGSGTLRVRGNFLWTDGTMSGSARTIVEPGATLKRRRRERCVVGRPHIGERRDSSLVRREHRNEFRCGHHQPRGSVIRGSRRRHS